MEKKFLKINENTIIRNIKESDYEFEVSLLEDATLKIIEIWPSSVLEINMLAKKEKEVMDYSNRVLIALMLYKLGSIYPIEKHTDKETIIWRTGKSISHPNYNYAEHMKYKIDQSEIDNFTYIVDFLVKKLDFEEDKRTYLNYSIERYDSALLESIGNDRRLMYAIMGLESLLLKEEETSELIFKLSIRVAKLLGNLGLISHKVKEHVKQAYNYRSKTVHGSCLKNKEKTEIKILLPIILNYLRLAILFFLMNTDIEKEEIIEIIDNSMLDNKYENKLEDLSITVPKKILH